MSHFRPRLRDDVDLERAWRVIAPPEEPRPHAVWVVLVGEDERPYTRVVQVEDAFHLPPPEREHVFVDFLRDLVDDAGGPVVRLAFLRTRPGLFGPTDDDLAWADFLRSLAEGAGLPCATVFLATDLVVVPVGGPPGVAAALASA